MLGTLTELGQALTGTVPPSDVVARVAATLDRLLAPEQMLVVMAPPDAAPTVAFSRGLVNPEPDDPFARLLLKNGPLVIARDVASTVASLGYDVPDAPASWVGAPLVASSVFGAVWLGSDRPGRFDNTARDLVSAVAALGSLALEKSRLVDLLSIGKHEWEQTVDALSQAFCVVDGAGSIRRANRAFGELASVPLTEIAGKPCIGLLPPTWAESVREVLADPAGAGVRDLHAGPRIFTLSGLLLNDVGERVAVLVFDDQTDTRRLQDQLVQSEKLSAIGQLIAGVAHDLNNPLASVVGFADYLLEAGQAPPNMVEPLRAIQLEAERAASIVRNLLTFARKQERKRRTQPVKPMLDATMLLLRNQLMSSKIEVEVEVAGDLPEVNVEPVQIQQVFVNLINNAAQAVTASGAGGHIRIEARRWLDGVAIIVEDDGPGIPQTLHEKVFEPFFTTKPEGQGTGLGLSICQGILKEHGGRLVLGNRPGGGTIFRVELPGGRPETGPVTPPTREPGTLRILVIDDEPHIQHYMQATLEAWGHTVVVAADGAQGLSRMENEPFDLVVSDLRMPELGGREMFEALSREKPELAERVVFSTGDTVRGDTLAFLESLGRPYLRKPFGLHELRAILATAVPR